MGIVPLSGHLTELRKDWLWVRFVWIALAPGGYLALASEWSQRVAWITYGAVSVACLLLAVGAGLEKFRKEESS